MKTSKHPDITYKVTASELQAAIDNTLSGIVRDSFLAPYEFRTLGTKAACEFLDISLSTIHRYIKSKKLIPLDHEGGNYKFTIKHLLEFNMYSMKSRNPR